MMNNLDVLLLNLPMSGSAKTVVAKFKSFPPLGLLYIGTVLQKNGYIVELIDLAVEMFDLQGFVNTLKKLNPRVIGMSTYNESWDAQKILTTIIKETIPNIKIVAGGVFATFCYKDILEDTCTDYVIRGEGEYSMLKLCDILLNNTIQHLNSVKGLIYKNDDGELHVAECERVKDLDQLPIPDRNMIDLNKYTLPFTISTARGCPGECIFCSSRAFWGKYVYFRSSESVFNEVLYLHKKYNNLVFLIIDDTFTASLKRIHDFCFRIKQTGINFEWGCETRADVITEYLIKTLCHGGCKKIDIGLESADNDILKKLKKKVTVENIENGIQIARKHGLRVTISFIIGHAFDTDATIKKTLNFARYIKEKYGVFVSGTVNTPFPGTEQFDKVDELGIKIHTQNWSEYRLDNAIISTKNISQKKLRRYYNDVLVLMRNKVGNVAHG